MSFFLSKQTNKKIQPKISYMYTVYNKESFLCVLKNICSEYMQITLKITLG